MRSSTAPGHTLVIPREHHERLQDLPDEPASWLYEVLHELTGAVENAVDADATTVAFNNGEAAGQEVPHVHGHIVPRFDDDGGGPVHAAFGERPDLSDGELDEIADAIDPDWSGRPDRRSDT
ncbi:HIT family protein [Halobacteriales archaeon QH_3_68_24]|nr:MAG: HIT family protein [Halobacteriales archaeon QH_3_68_24]